MLLRLAYFGVTNGLALLRLLPMSNRDKDAEIPALRHQIMVSNGNSVANGSGSTRPNGPGWPLCCTRYPDRCCTICGCSCARTRCCAGTAI